MHGPVNRLHRKPGSLELEELPKILREFHVDFDEKRLMDMFNIYDVDG